ncbi:hypothetical protein C2845_PM09G17410 [Panicum miliaceum]|uniref:Uncharacterized protein n=1 Tax=Panicum miliaceum TaxID=4540 RepID=A0A3L6S266_PANMI|nr:hypothetical protein C2845_PM09G17410 [Panicum miliaceum]
MAVAVQAWYSCSRAAARAAAARVLLLLAHPSPKAKLLLLPMPGAMPRVPPVPKLAEEEILFFHVIRRDGASVGKSWH